MPGELAIPAVRPFSGGGSACIRASAVCWIEGTASIFLPLHAPCRSYEAECGPRRVINIEFLIVNAAPCPLNPTLTITSSLISVVLPSSSIIEVPIYYSGKHVLHFILGKSSGTPKYKWIVWTMFSCKLRNFLDRTNAKADQPRTMERHYRVVLLLILSPGNPMSRKGLQIDTSEA